MGSKSKKTSITDDELLEQCIKANEECSHSTCSKSIKLIKLQCHLCSQNFCTKHLLPEVHGCGGAARKEAAAPPTKQQLSEVKHAQLENKLSKKLQQMKNERKKK